MTCPGYNSVSIPEFNHHTGKIHVIGCKSCICNLYSFLFILSTKVLFFCICVKKNTKISLCFHFLEEKMYICKWKTKTKAYERNIALGCCLDWEKGRRNKKVNDKQNMAILKFEEFLYSFLVQLKDKDIMTKEMKDALVKHFDLTEEDCSLKTKSDSAFQLNDRIGWCCQWFRCVLFIEIPQRATGWLFCVPIRLRGVYWKVRYAKTDFYSLHFWPWVCGRNASQSYRKRNNGVHTIKFWNK